MLILSAALDLLGLSVLNDVVLLADVIPSFLTKLCASCYAHAIPYHVRIHVFVGLSAYGMFSFSLTSGYADDSIISMELAGTIMTFSAAEGESWTSWAWPASMISPALQHGEVTLRGQAWLMQKRMLWPRQRQIWLSKCQFNLCMSAGGHDDHFLHRLLLRVVKKVSISRMNSLPINLPIFDAEADKDDLYNAIRDDEDWLRLLTSSFHNEWVKSG